MGGRARPRLAGLLLQFSGSAGQRVSGSAGQRVSGDGASAPLRLRVPALAVTGDNPVAILTGLRYRWLVPLLLPPPLTFRQWLLLNNPLLSGD
ncbi:MAG: hypothetical protein F4158_10940 [Synechococcus sp. SB0675_bin_7]|nr:hypothetical protein [Synechococcus sp. SB0675_bin_7]